jgi:hypothetical protein
MIDRQEIWCHNCSKYVQFDIDLSLNGNHVLNCPNCDHEHCRVVKDGIITDDRWSSRNGSTFIVSTGTITATTQSVTSTLYYASTQSGVGASILADAWLNHLVNTSG